MKESKSFEVDYILVKLWYLYIILPLIVFLMVPNMIWYMGVIEDVLYYLFSIRLTTYVFRIPIALSYLVIIWGMSYKLIEKKLRLKKIEFSADSILLIKENSLDKINLDTISKVWVSYERSENGDVTNKIREIKIIVNRSEFILKIGVNSVLLTSDEFYQTIETRLKLVNRKYRFKDNVGAMKYYLRMYDLRDKQKYGRE